MQFSVARESLIKPLQMISGVVEKRQTLPVLSNVLMSLTGSELSLTGTDLEVELTGKIIVESTESDGQVTVPARKLFDICKSLPDDSSISILLEGTSAWLSQADQGLVWQHFQQQSFRRLLRSLKRFPSNWLSLS